MFEDLKKFEGLNYLEQAVRLEELLEAAGFSQEERRSRKGIENFVFSKDGVDTSFIEIIKPSGEWACTVTDNSVCAKVFGVRGRTLNFTDRHDEKRKIIFFEEGKNIALHRVVVDAKDGLSVDHRAHSTFINTEEMLRECTNMENSRNKRFYSRINAGNRSFSIKDNVEDVEVKSMLEDAGYKFRRGRIYSPKFDSQTALYREVNRLEKALFGEFAYDPLMDFRDTFYAYVAYRCLGWYSLEEVKEYNREYFLEHNSGVSEYYLLKEEVV